jgi:hypothetical protein
MEVHYKSEIEILSRASSIASYEAWKPKGSSIYYRVAMMGQSGPSIAALTLRTRAVYFLPVGYEFIEVEIRAGDAGSKAWVTEKVPVEKNGTALVDFWARIPTSTIGDKTYISLKVCIFNTVCVDTMRDALVHGTPACDTMHGWHGH